MEKSEVGFGNVPMSAFGISIVLRSVQRSGEMGETLCCEKGSKCENKC